MGIKIEPGMTAEQLAQTLLGDQRLTHDLQIPGWDGKGPLPVGQMAYIKGEPPGPPARNWAKERPDG